VSVDLLLSHTHTPQCLFSAELAKEGAIVTFSGSAVTALSIFLPDALLNFETVKYFNAELHEEERYNASFEDYARAQIKTQRIFAISSLGQNFLITSAIVSAMILAAREVLQGTMEVADFVTIYSYILSVYSPLESLGMLYRILKQQILDVEGMFQLLKEPLEIVDKPGASELILKPDEEAEIEFRNVQFSYENEKAVGIGSKKVKGPLIKNLSFKIGAGQKVAIVGASGECSLIQKL
jgi:ATP-binding cassette subfamily B protein